MSTFSGNVVKGEGIADKVFGTATANLDLNESICLDIGIYAGWVEYDGKRYGASICYGDEENPKFEVHILDFDKDIVGEELHGKVLEKVSEYVSGYSTERLRQKVIHDVSLCREALKKYDIK